MEKIAKTLISFTCLVLAPDLRLLGQRDGVIKHLSEDLAPFQEINDD